MDAQELAEQLDAAWAAEHERTRPEGIMVERRA